MNILIAGGGLIGESICAELSKKNNVTILELDSKKCNYLAAKYGALVLHGNATDVNIIQQVEEKNFDIAITTFNQDSENLVFSILCKNIGIKEIFVKMNDPQYLEAYKIAGATNIASAYQMVTEKFTLDVENPNIRQLASFGKGKATISMITIKNDSKIVGMRVSQLAQFKSFPTDIVIGGLFDVEKDKLIIPRGNTIFKGNVNMFLVGPRESIEKAYKFIK